VIAPWEIRNQAMFGKDSNAGKLNYIFAGDDYDFFSYSKTANPGTLMKLGVMATWRFKK
jgi:hypothetical protein